MENDFKNLLKSKYSILALLFQVLSSAVMYTICIARDPKVMVCIE